jgi:hypothetical protein
VKRVDPELAPASQIEVSRSTWGSKSEIHLSAVVKAVFTVFPIVVAISVRDALEMLKETLVYLCCGVSVLTIPPP